MGIFDKKISIIGGEKSTIDAKSREKTPSPPPAYRIEDLPDNEDALVSHIRKLNLSRAANTKPGAIPSNDECIAHLKLLTAFAGLREEISEQDGLFGLKDSVADTYISSQNMIKNRKELIVKIREKRWAVFVTRAVDRFARWWHTCVPETPVGSGNGGRLQMSDVLLGNFSFKTLMEKNEDFKWTVFPPLDVLMVLHSFMLNPRDFLEDCIRQCRMPLWFTGFPWASVNNLIDDRTFNFDAPPEMQGNFEAATDLAWNNVDDPAEKNLPCRRCGNNMRVVYTDSNPYTNTTSFGLANPFETGEGFADKKFTGQCTTCSASNTHEWLRIAKFQNDVRNLMDYNIPMPGTLLSLDGVPEAALDTREPSKHEIFFPNRLIRTGLANDLLSAPRPGTKEKGRVSEIRDIIEQGLKDRDLTTKANTKNFHRQLKRGEKIAIRRMMSHYWDNSSPFLIDLVGAVLRQGVFVDKMKGIDWIHSPALEFTISRLLSKYEVFFRIMAESPTQVAVPTLDVDLAWHTHQLDPIRYFMYSIKTCNGVVIDHDDKISETDLNRHFAWTSKRYQKLTNGDIYSECTCWYCEAIRESHNNTMFASVQTSTAKENALKLHDRKDLSANPNKNAHISAHSAVRAESIFANRIAASQQAKLQADYVKAVRKAKKAGKNPPDRAAYAYAYVWGYPMFMPMYYPYSTDPCITGSTYVNNPTCMSVEAGAAGNCAAGSCGGGVAAGACAGAAGGCRGAGAGFGGCGGGGGSGGCGGGGGGCGGGCGGGG